MTEVSRRAALCAGAVGAAFAAVAGAPAAVASAAAATKPGLYSRLRFAPLRRQSFRLIGPTRSWRVKLTRVGNLPGAPRRDKSQFCLTFRCGVAGPPQGSYILKRRGFRPTKLFLVPSEDRRTYHAVINRAR